MTRPKKHMLAFEQEYNFEMFGICSHHNDYRLAWGINEKLGIQLTKCDEDYVVVNKKGVKMSAHSLYEYKDVENLTEYYLIKNKDFGKFLIPEKPSIDFFLFLFENHVWDQDELIDLLRNVPSVLGGYAFDPEEFDSTQNLVFN